jgi:hypothetical protein
MKKLLLFCLVAAISSVPSSAEELLYGNNAVGGTPYVYQIDPTTGNILNTYTNLSGYNGRGVVVVGDTMYYTTASDNNVYQYNLVTQTDMGVAFSVAGSTALSTIAYDGTNFWIGDYSGTNHAYQYSPTGTLLKTVTLADCGGYCDGLEYFVSGGQGYLISNEYDGGYGGANTYDVYDTNGTLITHDLFSQTNGTGIAWSGTGFFVSNIFGSSISEYGMDGTFLGSINLSGYPAGYSPLVEDLSFNYSQTLPAAEPGELALILVGSALVGLGGLARRRLWNA